MHCPENSMKKKPIPTNHSCCSPCPPQFPCSLFFKDRIVIPLQQMREKLLAEFHFSPMAGHSGIQATMAQISACFYWPTPWRVWEDLSMDFITNLPQSFGHTVIWVICDRLTKSIHLVGLPTHFQAQDLARRFAAEIFRLLGCPKSIVSPRDGRSNWSGKQKPWMLSALLHKRKSS